MFALMVYILLLSTDDVHMYYYYPLMVYLLLLSSDGIYIIIII